MIQRLILGINIVYRYILGILNFKYKLLLHLLAFSVSHHFYYINVISSKRSSVNGKSIIRLVYVPTYDNNL